MAVRLVLEAALQFVEFRFERPRLRGVRIGYHPEFAAAFVREFDPLQPHRMIPAIRSAQGAVELTPALGPRQTRAGVAKQLGKVQAHQGLCRSVAAALGKPRIGPRHAAIPTQRDALVHRLGECHEIPLGNLAYGPNCD